MPRPRRLGATPERSRPRSRIAPEVGSTQPPIICRVVVSPQPEGPSRETNSPCRTESETPSTAVTGPKRRVRPSRTRKPIVAVPSALDLARPAAVPLLPLLVRGVPVDDAQPPHRLRPVGDVARL